MSQVERTGRWPGRVDVPLAAVLLIIGLGGTHPAARRQDLTVPPPGYLLVAIAALGLLFWRVRPLWSLAITTTATMIYLVAGYAFGPILFSQVAAIFGAALWLPLRRAVIAIGAVVAAALIVAGTDIALREAGWSGFGATSVAALLAWVIIPAAIGIAIRSRREATVEVRAARARRAVSEERLRLAQEVHDVAGHGFAVIAMQAGVALRVLDRDPDAARAALQGIREASREALSGLRAEVEALRMGSDAPRRPRSGLVDLPALAQRIRATGLPVTLSTPEFTVELPADVDHAAYRIVQEALTNVLRHAGPGASAQVDVAIRGDALRVTVRDDGRARTVAEAAPGSGQGIEGMRHRAASVGGTLSAGPAPEGGFLVQASLPLAPVDRRAATDGGSAVESGA
ncbi:MAG TPA: histidine kinase [Micromonosporaceae bacterium]|jgi:signal transduction histidine kinase